MSDAPRPHKGQTRRHEPDEFSAWRDHSHPQDPAKDTEHMDVLDPERPSGSRAISFSVGDRVRCADPAIDSAYRNSTGTVVWAHPSGDAYDVEFDLGGGGMFHRRMLKLASGIRWYR